MEIQFEKYIRDTLEAKELGNAYQFVFDKMENEGQKLIDNQFILTADEYTIKEWENWLGIPFDSNLTLDERKQQILLKLNMKPPYTFNNAIRQIYSFIGKEVNVTFDNARLVFQVFATGLSDFTKKIIENYLKRILPVNVVFRIVTTNIWEQVLNRGNWQDVLDFGTWDDVLNNENI